VSEAVNDFVDSVARDDHDAIAIAEQKIAGANGHCPDRDRFPIAIGDPALDDIRWREKGTEYGESLREHEVGIARSSVDDVAQHTTRRKRLRR